MGPETEPWSAKSSTTEFGADKFSKWIWLLVLPAGGRFETTLALTLGEVMKPSRVLTPLPVVSIARTGAFTVAVPVCEKPPAVSKMTLPPAVTLILPASVSG